MREIRTLRSTWRGLETWHGIGLNRRASPRPYLCGGRPVMGVPTAINALSLIANSAALVEAARFGSERRRLEWPPYTPARQVHVHPGPGAKDARHLPMQTDLPGARHIAKEKAAS